MATPAEVRTGNLEGALIQAFADLLLQADAGFPTTPQDMLDAGADEFVSVSDRDFKYAMAGYLILGFLAQEPAYVCTDALSGPFTGENRSLASCIDQVIAAIQVADPGYDGTWQTLAPKANDFSSVPHRVRRGCLLYCAWAYMDQSGGAATLTEAILAGCCCGTKGLYQAISEILIYGPDGGGFTPPLTSDALLFGVGDQVTLEDGTNTLDNETTGAGEVLIGDLTEATDVDPTDLTYAVDDPGGSPLSRKITIQDLFDSLVNLLTGADTVDPTALVPIITDPSGSPIPVAVTLQNLYEYLLILGAVLPDGFQLRTHGGTNNAIGADATWNGPGYWNNGFGNPVVLNGANAVDDLLAVHQNNQYYYSGHSVRLNQYPILQFVGRWFTNLNRYTVGFIQNGGVWNQDAPTTECVMFHAYASEEFWRIIIHDGGSVVLNMITTEPIEQTNLDYELKIVVTDTPSIQFWIRGSMYHEETVNLPNFNDYFLTSMNVGSSDPNAWINCKMLNLIAPNF